jgi:hypothetical protein
MEEQKIQNEPNTNKLRWYQYRLSSLLLFVLVVTILLSLWRTYYQSQYGIAEKIKSAWGDCEYEGDTIVGVNLSGGTVNDQIMERIILLPHLKWLILGGPSVTDQQLEHLKSLNKLDILILDSTLTTESGEDSLKKAMPHLKVFKATWRTVAEMLLLKKDIRYHYTIPTDQIQDLKGFLPRCIIPKTSVVLDYETEVGAGFGDYSYRPLVDMMCIKNREYFECSIQLQTYVLVIEGKWFTDSDVVRVIQSPKLKSLGLKETSISSQGIKRLKEMPQLRNLVVDGQVLIRPKPQNISN